MTPKEKAKELYRKYDNLLNGDFIHPIVYENQLKQCALIAVDEILEDRLVIDGIRIINDPYWIEVKEEILKL